MQKFMKSIANFFKKAVSAIIKIPFIFKIVIGLVIGIALALLAPNATFVAVFGKVFTTALKAIAPVLVFVLIANALSSAGGNLGSRFFKVICLYLSTTFLASILAVIGSFIFKLEIPLADKPDGYTPPTGLGDVFSTLLSNLVENPVSAIINGNYVGILTWAIMLGLALKIVGGEKTKEFMGDLAKAVSKIVGWIIQLAPIGVMGLVYSSVSELGMNIFVDYGALLLLLVGCMLMLSLIINPLIIAACLKRNK